MPIANIAAFSALLASFTILAQSTTVPDSECDCFLTNDTAPTYFRFHGFWDSRSLSQYAVVNPPGLKLSVEESANADFTTPYLNYDSEFGAFWHHPRRRRGQLTPQPELAENPVHRAQQRPPKRKLPSHANCAPRQFPDLPPNLSPDNNSTVSPCACTLCQPAPKAPAPSISTYRHAQKEAL